MPHRILNSATCGLLLLTLGLFLPHVAISAEYLILGLDTKVELRPEGVTKVKPKTDQVVIYDIGADPENPKLLKAIPLINSMFGPPTNLLVAPDQKHAFVANSVNWKEIDGAWEAEPDNRIHVIDLSQAAPKVAGVVHSEPKGQPSGMAISRDGKWLAVANRAGKSVSLFEVDGPSLKNTSTVPIEGDAAAVAFTPDGKRILVTKFGQHAVAVLDVRDGKLEYDTENDLAVGRWPYNVQVTPNGQLALIANNGMNGLPDGHADTVSVVDLTASPARVIDHVTVGDGPEGMAISPDGKLALVPLLRGSAPLFEGKWFHNKQGSVAVLSIDGTQVTKIDEIPVGRFPEGVGFSKDGRYAYVGNLLDKSMTILKIDGTQVTPLDKPVALPGYPASLRTELP